MATTQRRTLDLFPAQHTVHRSPARFRVLVAGRRFGKTQLALTELFFHAVGGPARNIWYIAPTYRMAKSIAWNRLKSLLETTPGVSLSETELSVRLANGSTISLRGADNYDSLRGSGLDFVVLDEFASMKPEVWPEIIRPALADRKGRALFIGTPQGHDHLYDRFQYARGIDPGGSDIAERDPEWEAFHFTTIDGGNVSSEELASAARELDQRLYAQEFEASFESTAVGLAYHAFSRADNVRKCEYRPNAQIIWSLDFNVNPMCSVIAQRDKDIVEVLEEVVIEDANTQLACQKFWDRVRWYRTSQSFGALKIEVYGDASGHQHRTCGTSTDWQIIRDYFSRLNGQAQLTLKAAASNPGVRDRINLVNARLLSAADERRLFIDPKCKHLIADFEKVCWVTDQHGQPTTELNKSDRMRTHASDALGYYLWQAFPMTPKIGEQTRRLL